MLDQPQKPKEKIDPQTAWSPSFPWQVIEALGQGITIVDANERFEYVNPAFAKMIGRTQDELIHFNVYDAVHPDDREKLRAENELRYANQPTTYEIRLIKPDNTIVYTHVSGTPRLENGRYAGSFTVITDLTEQKKAAEAEYTYKNLLANSNDAVITLNPDFNIQSWNQAAEQLYGWSSEEVLGKHIRDVIPATYIKETREDALNQFMSEHKWKGEVIQQHRDGHNLYILASSNRLFNEFGEPTSILGINRDITELKRAEQAIRESEERLRLLIDHAPVALAMFDADMHYIAHSPKWLNDYELQGQKIIGRLHYDVFPEIPERWKQIHQSALHGETLVVAEDRFIRKDGRIQWLRGEIRPWYTTTNTIGGILMFTEDITKQKATALALKHSEKRYRVILEDHPEMIMRAKADGTLIFANEAYCNQHNINTHNIIGRNFFSLLDDSVRPLVQAKIRRLTVENPVETSENPAYKNGKRHWMRWTDRGIFDEDGRLIEIQAVGYDITPRREAEEQLRRSEAQLQQILNTVPEGVILLTPHGQITRANPVAKELLTHLRPKTDTDKITMLGNRPFSDFLSPPPPGLWHELTHHGRIIEVIAQAVQEEDTLAGWVMMIYDATDERQIRQRMAQEERLVAIGQLAAGIAHDFNNILAVITLYSELISRHEQVPPRAKKQSATITTQANRASDLVQQILDFGRQSMLEPQILDLRPFLKQLINLLSRLLPETIHIRLDSQSQTAYTIKADPSRIQQAIMNLVVNARDSMLDEGGRLSLNLSTLNTANPISLFSDELPSGRWVQLQITDTGVGIPAEVFPRIFEPFFTTKEVGKGTGLGLAQVYGIIKQHQGYIDIATQPNQGTTFTLFFPLVASANTPTPTTSKPTVTQGQGQRILVVEDDLATRAALVDSLTTLNYQIVEVNNGREALTLLTKQETPSFDLILSDVVMPQMGGIALLKAIRQRAIHLPLVLLTGHALTDEINHLQDFNLTGWLLKPPSLEQLSQLLASALNH